MVQADVHQEQHQPAEHLKILGAQSNPFPPSEARDRHSYTITACLFIQHWASASRQDPGFNEMPELNMTVCQAPHT